MLLTGALAICVTPFLQNGIYQSWPYFASDFRSWPSSAPDSSRNSQYVMHFWRALACLRVSVESLGPLVQLQGKDLPKCYAGHRSHSGLYQVLYRSPRAFRSRLWALAVGILHLLTVPERTSTHVLTQLYDSACQCMLRRLQSPASVCSPFVWNANSEMCKDIYTAFNTNRAVCRGEDRRQTCAYRFSPTVNLDLVYIRDHIISLRTTVFPAKGTIK